MFIYANGKKRIYKNIYIFNIKEKLWIKIYIYIYFLRYKLGIFFLISDFIGPGLALPSGWASVRVTHVMTNVMTNAMTNAMTNVMTYVMTNVMSCVMTNVMTNVLTYK